MNTWDTIKSSLEPVAEKFYTNIETDIRLSQAISLKRIADALVRLQVPAKQPILMSAEEYAKYMKMEENKS